MPLASGTRLGPYEISGSLGAGGMGEVYRARDTRLGRDVAVKILSPLLAGDPASLARFSVEARAVAALSHPNIVALYDVGEQGAIAYAVTELLDGETLRERMSRGPVAPRKAIDYVQQVATAIAAAHDRGIVHRDLKPENVFVTIDGRIKVLDFGVAQVAVASASNATTVARTPDADRSGVLIGSVGYMAPEQARGLTIDHRADIFSLGCILFELLSGRRAFEGPTLADTISAVLHHDPGPVQIPSSPAADVLPLAQIQQIVRRCLEKSPAERFQSARDLAFALAMLTGTATAGAVAQRRREGRSYLPYLSLIGGVSLLAVIATAGAIGILWFLRRPEAPVTNQEVVRFALAATRTWSDAASISPDGRYIVFTGSAASVTPGAPSVALQRASSSALVTNRFWLRRLDTLEQQRLSDTETAVPMLFWSPDSRLLGYRVASAIVVRELPDGPPRVLAELPTVPQGAALNASGDIVIATPGGLYRMAVQGGAPQLLMPTEPGKELWRGFPNFLPDGQRFIFTVLTSGAGEQSLQTRAATLDGRELGTIATGMLGASYADGHLLFGAGGRLYAQPFNPANLSLSGVRRVLAEGVAQDWRAGRLDARASERGVLVFRTAPRDVAQFVLVDRSGKVLREIGTPDSFTNFAVSPDGHRIVTVRRDAASGRLSLWMIDVERGITSIATDPRDGEDADDPTWTRDGLQVAYRHGPKLVIRNAQGGAERTVIGREAYPDDFSPDGRYILYGQPQVDAYEQWALDVTNPNAQPIPLVKGVTLGDEARMAPNGSWVAYHSNETGGAQVYVIRFPPTGEKWQVSPAGGAQPRWSADGNELFFLDPEGRLMTVQLPGSDPRRAKAPEALFPTGLIVSDSLDQYAPVRDGFIVRAPISGGADASAVQVVVNWKGLIGGTK
jgi:Tol biopolymer transport system component